MANWKFWPWQRIPELGAQQWWSSVPQTASWILRGRSEAICLQAGESLVWVETGSKKLVRHTLKSTLQTGILSVRGWSWGVHERGKGFVDSPGSPRRRLHGNWAPSIWNRQIQGRNQREVQNDWPWYLHLAAWNPTQLKYHQEDNFPLTTPIYQVHHRSIQFWWFETLVDLYRSESVTQTIPMSNDTHQQYFSVPHLFQLDSSGFQ